MNLTEALEIVIQMAFRLGRTEGVTPRERTALRLAGIKAAMMRRHLTTSRTRREMERKSAVSLEEWHTEMRRILPCPACRVSHGNPLMVCTGAFDCAMQRCRYRCSPWNPEPAS